MKLFLQVLMAAVIFSSFGSSFTTVSVSTQPLPERGLSPQAVTDAHGQLHLIYFKGEPAHGDIFYVRSKDGGATFSKPIQVNSQRQSAMVIGTVRYPKLAVGRGGRVYVAWVGSSLAQPKVSTEIENKTPMLFSRLNDAKTAFEPQRNLVTTYAGLDGGGSVTADSEGNVYVAWHAPKDTPGEADRFVWIARSTDDGKTFAPETAANTDPTGACGCCGLEINTLANGHVVVAYRTATAVIHRNLVVLESTDHAQTFTARLTDPWEANACVMSTSSVSGSIVAWESRGEIHYTCLDRQPLSIHTIPGRGNAKHPAIARNTAGDFVIVWAEGTGWNKGGKIAWQVFDREARALTNGSADGLPAWSVPTAYAKPNGSFGILY